jgi:NADPH:quinone reductase-like Zn-dependent oxidoreductase
MGLEFSGVVEEVGSDASNGEQYQRGDEVFGLTYGGAYAEYVAVNKKMLIRKPAELSWEDCAAVPEVSTRHSSICSPSHHPLTSCRCS